MFNGVILMITFWLTLWLSLKIITSSPSLTFFDGIKVNLTGLCFVTLIFYANTILNILSVFNIIESSILFYITLSFTLLLVLFALKKSKKLFRCSKRNLIKYLKLNTGTLLFIPLLIYLFFQGLLYAPNNGDSMVYHLPIVEHVIFQRNLSFWPTIYSHQHDTMPGAELLILYINLLTKNDYLSFFPQFLAYIVIFSCGKSILEAFSSLFGNSKLFNIFFVIFLATPMYLLQASTTQNDLITTAISIWIIDLLVRNGFIEPKRKIKLANVLILILFGVSVGAYVKPTILVALVIPISAYLFLVFKDTSPNTLKISFANREVVYGLILTIFCALILVGPNLYKKLESRDLYHGGSTNLLYIKEVSAERIFNPFVSLQLHSPIPVQSSIIFNSAIEYLNKKFNEASKKMGAEYNTALTPHEDVVGNPIQIFSIFMIGIPSLLVVLIQCIRRKFNRYILIASIPLLSYLFFGLFIKNQPWLVRLQSPVFSTFLLIIATFEYIKPYFIKKLLSLFSVVLMTISILLAGYHLRMHSLRPLSIDRVNAFIFDNSGQYKDLRINDYYWHSGKNMKAADDFILKEIAKSPCQNIVLTTPPFYPIQSRARDQGLLFSYYLQELPQTIPKCYLRGPLPEGLNPNNYELIFDAGNQAKVFKHTMIPKSL